MSGYLPNQKQFQASEQGKKTKVLQCHGTSDPVVKFDWATKAREEILRQGVEDVVFEQCKLGKSLFLCFWGS